MGFLSYPSHRPPSDVNDGPKIHVLLGPPGTGKTDRLAQRYRSVLRSGPPGRVLWLAPNWRTAADLRARLLGPSLEGCFSPGVMTFAQFAEDQLQEVEQSIRPISGLMKRQILRQLLDEHLAAGRLQHFGPIATTTGLLDLVCGFFGELKRLEIWIDEFRNACNARGMTQKDRELLALYESYQQLLLKHGLYDAEGRFWSARDWLQKSERPRFELVVADGFTDFTRTQHEILQSLGRRVGEMWISLPLEGEPCRADLFAKPRKTLEELRRRHPGLRVETVDRPTAPAWPALAHLERSLFGNPRQACPAADTAGLEILVAGRAIGEIEMVGQRIKELLTTSGSADGGLAPFAAQQPVGCSAQMVPVPFAAPVPPGQIAVVFRHPQQSAELVREVFDRLGIPYAIEADRPLRASRALLALVALLELANDDWPMEQLLAVLGSNYFQPDWPAWQDGAILPAAERMIRLARIPRGRQRLMESLAAVEPSVEREAVLAVLQALTEALDELPERAALEEWGRAWRRLAERVGMFRAIGEEEGQTSTSEYDELDRQAWRRLDEALAESRRLARWLGRDCEPLDRRQAMTALADLMSSQTIGAAVDESGRVRVVSAISARRLRVPYLFVAGLTEKSFPSPAREDRLYGEGDYQRLIDEGLPLPSRADRQSDEMLLFYEVVTGAARRLWLSYPALDESGEPLSPSPYLREVEQACGEGRIPRVERMDLSPVPAGDELLSPDTLRVRAVATALEGDGSLLAGLIAHAPEAAQDILDGLRLLALRQDREKFGPAEGMLSEATCAPLLRRFSPDRVYSATELEDYASCPFRFFLGRVLKAEPLAEIKLEIDYLDRGHLAHEVLAVFHRRVNEAAGGPASPASLPLETCRQLLDETIAEVAATEAGQTLFGALREINRRTLLEWLAEYRTQHEAYDAACQKGGASLRPELFEVSFGLTGPRRGGSGSTDDSLELRCGNRAVQLSGRIDRIDVGHIGGREVFSVLDYKTGSVSRFNADDVARGTALQLPLYALAAAELILKDRRAVPWLAGYWQVAGDGFKPRQALTMCEPCETGPQPLEFWSEVCASLADIVTRLVDRIRQGEFPVASVDPDCTGRCPYSTVCRINQVRSLEKTWQP